MGFLDSKSMSEDEELRQRIDQMRKQREQWGKDWRLLCQLGYRAKGYKKQQGRKLLIKDRLRRILTLQGEGLSIEDIAKRLRRKPNYIQLILENQPRIMEW